MIQVMLCGNTHRRPWGLKEVAACQHTLQADRAAAHPLPVLCNWLMLQQAVQCSWVKYHSPVATALAKCELGRLLVSLALA